MFRKKASVELPDLRSLRSGLCEAAAWCECDQADVTHVRAAKLLPPQPDGNVDGTPLNRLLTNPHALVAAVVRARSRELLVRSARLPTNAELSVSRGRLMRCEFWASLADGACYVESQGFLDEDDLPPCGTWCGLLTRPASPASSNTKPALIAWIPQQHIADVDAAIPCCPTEVNEWLDVVDQKLARSLLRRV